MATKEYIAKYRQLKQIYERELNKQIADITWYRVVATLKQHFSFEVQAVDAQKIVEGFAGLKRRYGSFTGRGEGFTERWQAFRHFYEIDAQYQGGEFLKLLADYLKINLDDVPRSTRYYWFEKAGLSFSAENIYHCKDLALVAFIAAKWAINKRSQPMKSATISVLTLAL
ncbi:MAG: hypothetical protein RM368_32660 [Nostoc sp. DedSLP03]|uniref:hypothetical protein n=1 Tax=unclassified Nostoc TaxID=2593658 RepID=UPI0015C2FA8D|nr:MULTISPECIES: hypothetical protein [unclassified Nostoc]MDZ7969641.1 hypothetical protein [Nostoc sp. DedSLP03]QLE53089.1 hypothetical protein FD724_34635 [Nostoc sp. C057]